MDVDVVVVNGTVVDGTGSAPFGADIGIRDGRIAAVCRSEGTVLRGAVTIDATGLVVAPGFVDSNTHADWVLTSPQRDQLLASMVQQGVTTVVGGGCGFSPAPVDTAHVEELRSLTGFLHDDDYRFAWTSFGEFAGTWVQPDLPLNVALMVGQQALRCAVAGTRAGPLDRRELMRLRALVRDALGCGAVGVSGNVGFVPGVYADGAELRVLAEEAAAAGAVMSVHARAYTRLAPVYGLRPGPAHHIRAVRELVELARRTGARMQISHLAVVGRRAWPSARAVLAEFDAADADVGFDVVPYPVGVGPLQMIFPPWAVPGLTGGRVRAGMRLSVAGLARLQRRLVGLDHDDLQLLGTAMPDLAPLSGLTFGAIAARLGTSPIGAELEIARRTRLAGMVAVHAFSGDVTDDAPLQQLLGHSRAAVISNAALAATGVPNPAAYGAFPRLLGRYARDHAVFPLEEAIRRATSLPADRMRLCDVGRITEGYRADLVILDPATIADFGWPDKPAGPPAGIHGVLIAGRPAPLARAAGRPADTTLLREEVSIHPRPAPFTGGHPDRVRAGRGRSRAPVNAGPHCWKACWQRRYCGHQPGMLSSQSGEAGFGCGPAVHPLERPGASPPTTRSWLIGSCQCRAPAGFQGDGMAAAHLAAAFSRCCCCFPARCRRRARGGGRVAGALRSP